MKILVTGGCGYIGAHTIVDLLQHGFEVISADMCRKTTEDILKGVQRITGKEVKNYKIDLCQPDLTAQIFNENTDIQGVIHFAALKSVPESVANPLLYYHNNIASLVNILNNVVEHQVPYFVFSSSCSVYGNTPQLPVTEQTPWQKAVSPYAHTKQIGEDMLQACVRAYKMSAILLRYFNPAGAHPSSHIGEIQETPENLVPYITQTALGLRPQLTVFGDDYNTRDGSCIRDYIHVVDIAHAHTQALRYLMNQKEPLANAEVFNLGSGSGATVLEVIAAFERASGRHLPYQIGKRRAGDVEQIYANNDKAAGLLDWQPQYTLDDVMQTAWQWELYWRSPNFRW